MESDLSVHSLTIQACELKDGGQYTFTVGAVSTEALLSVQGIFCNLTPSDYD